MNEDPHPLARALVARLADQPGRVSDLARIFVDDLLDRPIHEWIEPERAARAITSALGGMADIDDLAALFARRVLEARTRAQAVGERSLAEALPMGVLEPLERIAGRPHVPSRALVAALVDRPALHGLARAVLTATLTDFAAKLRAAVPTAEGRRATTGLGALADLAKGVAGAVAGAVEKTFEERARAYVEGAIGSAIDMSIDRLASDAHAGDLAQYRVEVLRWALTAPLETFAREVDGMDTQALAGDWAEIVRALAADAGLAARLDAAFREIMGVAEDTSLSDWLEGTGALAPIRAQLHAWASDRLAEFFADARFMAWLSDLLDDPSS